MNIPLPEDGSPPQLSPAIIRWIFATRATRLPNGKRISTLSIADALAANGVPTPGDTTGKPGPWTSSKVARILRRSVYKGRVTRTVPIFQWERKAGFDYGGGGKIEVELADEAWRMVDDDTWEGAQAVPGTRGNPGGRHPPFLLTNKVICRTCGSPMRIFSGGGGSHFYCELGPRRSGCPRLHFSNRILETLALRAIEDALGTEAEAAFQQELLHRSKASHAARLVERDALEAEVDTLKEELAANIRLARRNENTPFGDQVENESRTMTAALMVAEDALAKLERELVEPGETLATSQANAKAAISRIASDGTGPYRPKDAEEIELLQILSDAIAHVQLVEVDHGRFDVLFQFSGEPWGTTELGPLIRFERQLVSNALERKERVERLFAESMATRKFRPSDELLASLELSDALSRFPQNVPAVVEAITAAIVLGITPTWANQLMKHSMSLERSTIRYWCTAECAVLRRRLAEIHGVDLDEDKVRIKGNGSRTIREWLMADNHAILKYPVADPLSGETRMPDADWQVAVDMGVAFPNGKIEGGSGPSDRKYFEAFLHLVRDNLRYLDLPASACRNLMKVQRVRRLIDNSGATERLTKALLLARGIVLSPEERVPPFYNPACRAAYGRTKSSNGKKPYDPQTDHRPPLAVRPRVSRGTKR